MSRKYSAAYDEDDYWDEYEEEDWYDEYDEVPQQKPKPAAAASQAKGKAKGKGQAAAKTAPPAAKKPASKPIAAAPPGGASAGTVRPFQFDTPSPDDLVQEAQAGRKISSSQGAAGGPSQEPSAKLAEGVAAMKVDTAVPKRSLSEYRMGAKLASACAEAAAKEHADAGGKPGLHLVVLGHVDAGKSTLMGRLLHDLGVVDQRTVHKHEKEAAQAGKASFSWAWLLDERPEERARGVTVDVAVSGFETPGFVVTLLDAPGHRDFIPNMITGAAQADAALLLVDGSIGGFEAGFEGKGQTREHAQLARSLGIDQAAVVISKLDTCEYSQERFDEVQAALAPFLKTCGFREETIQWLPAVGPTGENLVKPPQDPRLAKWWSGKTLVQAIDSFAPRERLVEQPLRMPLSETGKSRSLGGDSVSGKVVSGGLLPGMRVMVQPSGQIGVVKGLEVGHRPAEVVRSGDGASVGISGIDQNVLLPGVSVLCDPEWPIPVVTKLEAKLLILDVAFPIVAGQPATLHIHVSKEEASITKLIAKLDSKTGEVQKAKPRCLLKGQTAVVEVELSRAVCMEHYADIRPLGRVTLRDAGATFAVGIVQRIIS